MARVRATAVCFIDNHLRAVGEEFEFDGVVSKLSPFELVGGQSEHGPSEEDSEPEAKPRARREK